MKQLRNVFVIGIALLAFSALGQAKTKKVKTPPKDPQDEIEIIGHINLNSEPVTRFLATQHYSSYYLYAEHQGGKNVTLIDVTKAAQPAILADVAYPPSGDGTNLTVVAGTAALVTSEPQLQTPSPPQTMRLMDFSDPQHPKVTREFTGITAMNRDDRRGLIFLANADGIWILHQSLAEDPEVQRAYAYYAIYGPSMYPPPK